MLNICMILACSLFAESGCQFCFCCRTTSYLPKWCPYNRMLRLHDQICYGSEEPLSVLSILHDMTDTYKQRGKQSAFAAVWLVMGGDRYVPGALVSAYSWRRSGSKVDCVCMVTPDVSHFAVEDLGHVFDHVIPIDYLNQPCIRLNTYKKRQMYNEWAEQSFTKWTVLSLTQYEKVLFLDADTLVLRCMDELFELPTPAGTFSSPWHYPFNPFARKPNPFLRFSHGEAIPRETMARGYHTSFLIGTSVLLCPSETDWTDLKRWLKKQVPFGYARCGSMLDEQCIAAFYHECRPETTWHYLHQRFNYIPWKPAWLPDARDRDDPFVFHYFNKKPWELSRDEYKDLERWWQMAKQLCTQFPNVSQYFKLLRDQ